MLEKTNKPISGYLMVILLAITLIVCFPMLIISQNPIFVFPMILVILLVLPGLFFIYPNGSRVLTLFGKYIGTVKDNGLFWVNPFYKRQKISLRARNFDSERVKVNDKRGNPILISVILVWRVRNTYQAAFEVDDYVSFVRVQSDAAVRKLAGMYDYDNFDDDQKEITLRSGMVEVNENLEKELQERVNISGIEVMEARIGYLAYAPEIASAMLKRQQAEAIVAARLKIVEGAVSMVEIALDDLTDKGIVDLDIDQKAVMVNNLMLVLCSDKDATPVINAGTLNN